MEWGEGDVWTSSVMLPAGTWEFKVPTCSPSRHGSPLSRPCPALPCPDFSCHGKATQSIWPLTCLLRDLFTPRAAQCVITAGDMQDWEDGDNRVIEVRRGCAGWPACGRCCWAGMSCPDAWVHPAGLGLRVPAACAAQIPNMEVWRPGGMDAGLLEVTCTWGETAATSSMMSIDDELDGTGSAPR